MCRSLGTPLDTSDCSHTWLGGVFRLMVLKNVIKLSRFFSKLNLRNSADAFFQAVLFLRDRARRKAAYSLSRLSLASCTSRHHHGLGKYFEGEYWGMHVSAALRSLSYSWLMRSWSGMSSGKPSISCHAICVEYSSRLAFL